MIDPDGESREFAIVVSDGMPHQGIGSLSVKRLMDAARNHRLAAMEGVVLADNAGMLEPMRSLGYSIRRDRQENGPHLVARRLWRRAAEDYVPNPAAAATVIRDLAEAVGEPVAVDPDRIVDPTFAMALESRPAYPSVPGVPGARGMNFSATPYPPSRIDRQAINRPRPRHSAASWPGPDDQSRRPGRARRDLEGHQQQDRDPVRGADRRPRSIADTGCREMPGSYLAACRCPRPAPHARLR